MGSQTVLTPLLDLPQKGMGAWRLYQKAFFLETAESQRRCKYFIINADFLCAFAPLRLKRLLREPLLSYIKKKMSNAFLVLHSNTNS